MSDRHPRDHLEHLPGRTFLIALAVICSAVVIAAVSQLVSAEQTDDSVLWSLVVAVGVLTLLALGVAWEERRAHVHALVRQATEHDFPPGGPDPMAELLRMGAHREVDYLRTQETRGVTEQP